MSNSQEQRYQIYALMKAGISQTEIAKLDNEKVFARHEKIATASQVDFCFAHPYSSWERGLNENIDGLIRQYFPPKHDFTTITEKDVSMVMNKLNNRPRKCLAFKTLNQVFFNINQKLHFKFKFASLI